MPILENYIFDPKIIARGFTSVVYKDEEVAIKCIDQSVLDDPSKKKMLSKEMNIQGSLRGEANIVQLKAQFYQKDSIYIVTEFCEYGDLKNKIKQKGKFVEAKAVSFMLDILHGFQALVKNNIVHRDIKPSNIFISKKGIKIGDFGFAYKNVQNTTNLHEINVPSAGSPLYQAPEVLKDGQNASHLSDIWSLGVVFFEMVTGRLPFPAKNKEGLMKLIENIGIRTLIPQSLSLKSKEFLVRTLKKDPTKRITPEELKVFEFDDQILFKIQQHRAKKRQEEIQKALNVKQEVKCPKTNNSVTKTNKSEHSDSITVINKNKTEFEKFDNNIHDGKCFLNPKDIHPEKFKKKSIEKKQSEKEKPENEKKNIEKVVNTKKNNQIEVQIKTQNSKGHQYKVKQTKKEQNRLPQKIKRHENQEKETTKRKDSAVSIDKKIEQRNEMQKSQIIDCLLNEIDIIRFLSRIVHKIEQIHHLHVSESKQSPKQNEKDSPSPNVQKGLLNSEQVPEVYVQVKVLMYRTILQIERLEFLSEEQAHKFMRSEEYEEIKTILDTYKSKLDLTSLKSQNWKGLRSLQHDLEEEILLIYNKAKQYINYIETHCPQTDPESKQIKKLAHKIQALNYMMVLRYEYLIMQREDVMIAEQTKKCSLIKAMIEEKHSNQHEVKRSFENWKDQFRLLEKKIKQLRLI